VHGLVGASPDGYNTVGGDIITLLVGNLVGADRLSVSVANASCAIVLDDAGTAATPAQVKSVVIDAQLAARAPAAAGRQHRQLGSTGAAQRAANHTGDAAVGGRGVTRAGGTRSTGAAHHTGSTGRADSAQPRGCGPARHAQHLHG
jgi:hypothetical protein